MNILAEKSGCDSVRLSAVDATNYDSLENALCGINGTLCVITEGLLMYFTESELTAITENIRKILSKRGGCWITSDPELLKTHSPISKAVSGGKLSDSPSNVTSILEEKSDTSMSKSGNSVCPGVTHAACWKMTLSENAETSRTSSAGKRFSIHAKITGDILSLNLSGRLDTITAPELLAFWEKVKAEDEINAVKIDCDSLEYISSAGLRVLLIMHNGSNEGVELSAVNNTVRDILSQTGFDLLLKISD